MTSSSSSFEVRVGNRIWLDGQGWDICELTGESVRLRGADTIRTVSLSMLADVVIDPPESGEEAVVPAGAWEIPAVLLAGLTRAQQEQLSAKLAALRRVLEPDPDDDRPIVQRYEDEAATLGVSRRTLQRLGSKLLEVGPSGLVDGRLMAEDRRSIDPRWDEACREVMNAAVNASNPTRQWVISRANQAYLTSVPDGKVPSPAVAYRRVAELDKGRYTFGPGEAAPVGGEAAYWCAGSAAGGPPGAVRVDGFLPAGRVRDGAGHAALGEHRADGRDGSVR